MGPIFGELEDALSMFSAKIFQHQTFKFDTICLTHDHRWQHQTKTNMAEEEKSEDEPRYKYEFISLKPVCRS